MNTIKFALALSLLFISYPMFSQETTGDSEMKTLFHKNQGFGGYGALTARYSDIGSAPGAVIGFRGCMVAGHNIAIGIAGNGLVSNFKYDQKIGKDALWAGGYGGLHIEPIISPKSAIHLALPVTVGAGGISYAFDNYQNTWDSNNNTRNDVDSQAFFIIEPGVEIELNLLKYFRLALGGYYRYTSNITLRYDDSTPINKSPGFLNGFSGGITLKFGKF